MKYKPFLSILLCAALSACTGNKKSTDSTEEQATDSIAIVEKIVELPPLAEGEVFLKEQDPFGDEIELHGTHISEVDTFIFRPSEPTIVIRDSLLLMRNFSSPYYAFRYPALTYIKSIGTIGKGPDEFMVPQLSPSADTEHVAYLLDGANGNVYGLGHDLKQVYLHNIYAGQKKGWGVDDFTNIAPNKYMYVYDSKPGKAIYEVEMEGDSAHINEVFNLTLNKNRKSPFAYIGSMGVNPLRNRMVYAYKYFKVIKFMDMEGKTVRTLNFQQKSFDDGTLKMADGLDANVTHYMKVLPTRDYVYITYSGRTPYVVAAEHAKQNYYMHIEQYDWNGNPIKKYKLNDFAVFSAINEKTNQLVLTAYYHDDPFVVYQLDN